jgi:hypothetical protein
VARGQLYTSRLPPPLYIYRSYAPLALSAWLPTCLEALVDHMLHCVHGSIKVALPQRSCQLVYRVLQVGLQAAQAATAETEAGGAMRRGQDFSVLKRRHTARAPPSSPPPEAAENTSRRAAAGSRQAAPGSSRQVAAAARTVQQRTAAGSSRQGRQQRSAPPPPHWVPPLRSPAQLPGPTAGPGCAAPQGWPHRSTPAPPPPARRLHAKQRWGAAGADGRVGAGGRTGESEGTEEA